VRADRRQFLIGLAALGAAGCASPTGDEDGAAGDEVVDNLSGTFGGVVELGPLDVVLAGIDEGHGFLSVPEGRMWITRYPEAGLAAAAEVYPPEILAGMELGLVALYQRCTHLGCRVPQCTSSQWFECPCHDSAFTRVGEWAAGPAPRGLDRFPIAQVDGVVQVDTAVVVEGPAPDVRTVAQDPEGPHCMSALDR
jgi:cytochrome b6-f complex iron-sulfur subunit